MKQAPVHSSNQLYLENFFIDIRNSAGTMPKLHIHSGYEIFYLISGVREYFTTETIFTIHAGEFAVIPSALPHRTIGHGNSYRALIGFTDAFLEKYLTPTAREQLKDVLSLSLRKPDEKLTPRILELLNELLHYYKTGDEKVFMPFLEILRIINDSERSDHRASASNERFKRIAEYVNKNFSSIKNLDEITEKFYISKPYLCRCFKRILGVSFVEYLHKVQLQHALQLLVSTDQPISIIATQCGFDSPAYFCSVFKKYYNDSPTRYRKNHSR